MRISISEFIHLGCALVAAAQSCVSPEQKPVVLLQTAAANGRSQAAGRASSVAASLGPHAAATSALAFAERLFAPDSLLQQAGDCRCVGSTPFLWHRGVLDHLPAKTRIFTRRGDSATLQH
mmetsp:Transcript_13064/g.22672  ORF Transcript_13064/g.22672 Transcript_13064/m.22672 type:complete len:121 (-) Transcript_13064:47-409(-)